MAYNPSKTNANYKQTMGSAKEGLGSTLGSTNLQASGHAQNMQGHGEHHAAQNKGWAQGAKDKVAGTVKEMTGAVTGNPAKKAEGKAQKHEGDYKRGVNA